MKHSMNKQGTQASGKKPPKRDKPIADVYSVIDTDLARDNIENDLPLADQEDL